MTMLKTLKISVCLLAFWGCSAADIAGLDNDESPSSPATSDLESTRDTTAYLFAHTITFTDTSSVEIRSDTRDFLLFGGIPVTPIRPAGPPHDVVLAEIRYQGQMQSDAWLSISCNGSGFQSTLLQPSQHPARSWKKASGFIKVAHFTEADCKITLKRRGQNSLITLKNEITFYWNRSRPHTQDSATVTVADHS